MKKKLVIINLFFGKGRYGMDENKKDKLINADTFDETFLRLYDSLNLIRSDYNRMKGVLAEMPTIDAVPVVHGHWINDKGLYMCSACNRLWPELWWVEIVPLEKMIEIIPFCPSCGAKMDGGDPDAAD